MRFSKLFALSLVALALAACSESNSVAPSTAAGTTEPQQAAGEKNSYQGVQWVESADGVTFAEVKAMARQQVKQIFIDFYADWCGPCKSMDKKVFPQKSVGDYYNARFINFKVDVEEGGGEALAEYYGVPGLPTLIYTDAEGEVLPAGFSAGYSGAEELLKLARGALGEA